MSDAAQIDFSSVGGVPVKNSASIDFSSIGGRPVGQAAPTMSSRPPVATIGPREGNAATQWFQDLENDVKNGTGTTFVGRALQKMGAEGTDTETGEKIGDFMASPILGTSRALRGTTEIPSHPWQGMKDVVGGALDATQIPSAFGTGEAIEGVSKLAANAQDAFQASRKAAQAASQAKAATDEWQKINDVLAVTPKGVRIGKNATTLEQAATMPGRGVANLGITSDELAKMSPIERMAAIAPHWQQAGAAIDAATTAATDAGKTLDAGKSAFSVLKGISDPALQDRAIETFNNLAKQLGIQNLRQASPEDALALRRALQSGARFGASGDLSSISSVRAGLYRAVSGDLQGAVPSLKQLDQNYSDLQGAITAAQNSVSQFASKAPPPTTAQKAAQFVRSEVLPNAVKYGVGGAVGYGGYAAIKNLLGE